MYSIAKRGLVGLLGAFKGASRPKGGPTPAPRYAKGGGTELGGFPNIKAFPNTVKPIL